MDCDGQGLVMRPPLESLQSQSTGLIITHYFLNSVGLSPALKNNFHIQDTSRYNYNLNFLVKIYVCSSCSNHLETCLFLTYIPYPPISRSLLKLYLPFYSNSHFHLSKHFPFLKCYLHRNVLGMLNKFMYFIYKMYFILVICLL